MADEFESDISSSEDQRGSSSSSHDSRELSSPGWRGPHLLSSDWEEGELSEPQRLAKVERQTAENLQYTIFHLDMVKREVRNILSQHINLNHQPEDPFFYIINNQRRFRINRIRTNSDLLASAVIKLQRQIEQEHRDRFADKLCAKRDLRNCARNIWLLQDQARFLNDERKKLQKIVAALMAIVALMALYLFCTWALSCSRQVSNW